MVGTTTGETMRARRALRPGTASRTSAMEASVPSIVASSVTAHATSKLRKVASFHDPLDQYAWYQRTDQVRGGNSRKSPPLNDMTMTRRLGTARYTRTRLVTTHSSGCVRSLVTPTPCRG